MEPFIQEDIREKVDRKLIYQELLNQIYTLTEREQKCIYFRFWEDLTYKAIGEIISLSKQTVSIHTERAIRKLRHPSRSKKLYIMLTGKTVNEFIKEREEQIKKENEIRRIEKEENEIIYKKHLEEQFKKYKLRSFIDAITTCRLKNPLSPERPPDCCELLFWNNEIWCVGAPENKNICVSDETYLRWLHWLLEDYFEKNKEKFKEIS